MQFGIAVFQNKQEVVMWFESRYGRDFPYSSTPALVPIQLSVKWVPGFLPGVKATEARR
jgi:hypothetical protein